MKYYVNYNAKRTLIDENENTSYLADKGYVQVSPAEYYKKSEEYFEELKEKYHKE